MPHLKAVVLREQAEFPGEFQFRIAKLRPEQAAEIEEQLASGTLDPDAVSGFGSAMDLSQAMHQLDTRDFVVINSPQEAQPV